MLVFGESGTGKQLVARELHARGELPQQPFLEQVCAAAAEPDLERALFGEKGRAGSLLAAERGTLLLIEIADLPLPLQARLAGVLRERAVQPPAGGRPVRLSCRVVATSTRDLREEVEAGRFREDLYYRLDVQRLELPPLRHRREDMALLLDHFARVHGNRTLVFTDNARSLLARYAWPGNVRELENEVRRLVALDVERISARQLSPEIREGRGVSTAKGALSGRTLQEVEKEMIEAALSDAKGNKAKAARQLGVPRSSLYGLMQRHGLE